MSGVKYSFRAEMASEGFGVEVYSSSITALESGTALKPGKTWGALRSGWALASRTVASKASVSKVIVT